jgi:hypothetical protein
MTLEANCNSHGHKFRIDNDDFKADIEFLPLRTFMHNGVNYTLSIRSIVPFTNLMPLDSSYEFMLFSPVIEQDPFLLYCYNGPLPIAEFTFKYDRFLPDAAHFVHRLVLPEHRGSGLGSSLYKEIELFLTNSTDIRNVWLHTGQPSVLAFTLNNGFKPTDARQAERLSKIEDFKNGLKTGLVLKKIINKGLEEEYYFDVNMLAEDNFEPVHLNAYRVNLSKSLLQPEVVSDLSATIAGKCKNL